MGSIPLPALNVKTPEQPDLLQKYGQLMQLKQASQQSQLQQQEAPLRMAALQQNVDQGGVQLQQAQQGQKDQQAMTAAMQSWDGKSLDDLAPLVLKNGGSATAIMGLKQHALEQKAKVSAIAKDDAATGASNVTTLIKKNDALSGALGSILQVPDDQLSQALLSTSAQLAQQGILDPQHVQMAQQLAQSGNIPQIRQQLDIMRKGITSNTQLLAQTKQEQDAANDKAMRDQAAANAKETQDYHQKEIGVRQQEVGIQGARLQLEKSRNDSMNGVPAEDVAKHFGMTPVAFDQQAEKYWTAGTLPPIGRSGNGAAMNRALMNRAAELHPDGSLASNSAEYKANSESLKKLQTNFDQTHAFEQTAEKNMDLLQTTAAKIPDLGSRFANVPARMISSSMIGSDNMASFKAALATAQAESAKVLNSASGSGVLSDSSRHELQNIIDGNAPVSAIVASMKTLKADMANRNEAYQQQLTDIQSRLKGPKPKDAGTPAPASSPSSDPFAQFGGKAH